MPVFFMKMVLLWPESQNAVTHFLAAWVLPVFNWVLIVGGVAFIVEGQYDSFVPPLTTVGDVIASSVCLAKLLLLGRSGPQLVRLRRHLQFAFHDLEALAEPEASAANARCVSRCRSMSRRFVWLYAPLSLSAGGLVVANAFASAATRRVTVNMPRAWLVYPYTYWPICFSSVIASSCFFFYSVGYDSLFLSLCMHLSCKCDILKVMLRRAGQHDEFHGREVGRGRKKYAFEYWNDDGSPCESSAVNGTRQEVESHLRACILYHHMVIKLRDETETIFAGVSLFQMGYILLALGIPALRVLHEKSFSVADVIFLLFYAAWNFSQLLFYCWFADIAAESSQEVSVAAYAAMRPAESNDGLLPSGVPPVCNLGKAGGTALQLITLRAQRPLHLTAGRFANLTLVLYLEIIRKSQSIYSYLIRMR